MASHSIELLQLAYSNAVTYILEDLQNFNEQVKKWSIKYREQIEEESDKIDELRIMQTRNSSFGDLALFSGIQELSMIPDRSCWTKERHSTFWEKDVCYFTDSDWISNFRMKRKDFCELTNLLQEEMAPSMLFIRQPIPVDKRIAIALYKLATCAEYRTVGNLFGVHKSTVKKMLFLFCDSVNKILFPNLIRMPSNEEAHQLAATVEREYKIPMCIGYIDGCHIPVTPPDEGRKDFINRKCYPSIVLQGVVDNDCKFRNVSCKVPGSAHDATVLKASSLYKSPSKFLPNGSKIINGKEILFYIYGDPAYPLLPWLHKGYQQGPNMTPEQESYNVYMSSVRIKVEHAFGRLKSRWRILYKKIDLNYKFVPNIIATCCTLHNFCEVRKAPIPHDTTTLLENVEIDFPQPMNRPSDATNDNAKVIRDHLCNYLAAEVPLRKSVYNFCV